MRLRCGGECAGLLLRFLPRILRSFGLHNTKVEGREAFGLPGHSLDQLAWLPSYVVHKASMRGPRDTPNDLSTIYQMSYGAARNCEVLFVAWAEAARRLPAAHNDGSELFKPGGKFLLKLSSGTT